MLYANELPSETPDPRPQGDGSCQQSRISNVPAFRDEGEQTSTMGEDNGNLTHTASLLDDDNDGAEIRRMLLAYEILLDRARSEGISQSHRHHPRRVVIRILQRS